MKAEHRKELETNVLADRMGRMVQNIKGGPQKRTVVFALLALVVVVAILLVVRSRAENTADNSKMWMWVEDGWIRAEDGSYRFVDQLVKDHPDTTQAKVIKFHRAKFMLWDMGLKMMGHSPTEAFNRIGTAKDRYNDLAEECKGDPVFEPEALFALAVIEETQTLRNQDHLESAKIKYQDLAEKYPDSAFGKLAQKQADNLKNHPQDVLKLYQDLQISFRVTDEKLRPKLAPPLPLSPLEPPPGN